MRSDRVKAQHAGGRFKDVPVSTGYGLEAYLQDESKLHGNSDAIFHPGDEGEVAAVLREAKERGIGVTVSANLTGVVGGGVPQGGWVLSLQRMDTLNGIGRDEEGFYIQCGPSPTLQRLDEVLMSGTFAGMEDLTPDAVSLLKEAGRHFYPVDPTETNASLGANVACDSSGSRSFRYGPTRDWVRRIRVVLSDGRLLDITRGQYGARGHTILIDEEVGSTELHVPAYDFNHEVKNTAGLYAEEDMDPIDLFIGSEGILGVITLVELRIIPWTPMLSCMTFLPDDEAAFSFVKGLRTGPTPLELIEFIGSTGMEMICEMREGGALFRGMPAPPRRPSTAVLFDLPYDDRLQERLDVIEELLARSGTSLSESWCAHEERERARFRSFRHAVPEAVFSYIACRKLEHPGLHKMGTDMSVPDRSADEMMEYYLKELGDSGLHWVMFGHIGDNHPHVEILVKDMEEYEKAGEILDRLAAKVVQLGGSPIAEHGAGRLRYGHMRLMYSEKEMGEMIRLKRELDPEWTLNPGVMLEVPR